MKFLQLKLGRWKDAEDLLMQTAREMSSELYKWSENSAWLQDASQRTRILVYSPDLSIGDFLESNAGFIWMEVAGVRVYSCYISTNDCDVEFLRLATPPARPCSLSFILLQFYIAKFHFVYGIGLSLKYGKELRDI